MCEHPVVTATRSDAESIGSTIWRLRCLTCPVEAVYVIHGFEQAAYRTP